MGPPSQSPAGLYSQFPQLRNQVVAWLQHRVAQPRELDSVVLVTDGPVKFLDFLFMQGGVKHMIMLHVHFVHLCLCSCIRTVHAGAHLFQPCQGQGGLLCLSAHTSQTNWTLGVKHAKAW